jgi:hypothetical protein
MKRRSLGSSDYFVRVGTVAFPDRAAPYTTVSFVKTGMGAIGQALMGPKP